MLFFVISNKLRIKKNQSINITLMSKLLEKIFIRIGHKICDIKFLK